MQQLGGFKLTRGTVSSLRVLNHGGLRLGPLHQQRQSLLMLHRRPRNKFLGEHIHSAKQRQLEEKPKKIQIPEDQRARRLHPVADPFEMRWHLCPVKA